MLDPIYLDHNATTPLLPEVIEAMLPYLHSHFGNPSSGHVYGQRARHAIERARAQVAELLGCEPTEIIFTGGGTEANNLAIRGALLTRPGQIVTSVIEHPATARPCALLEARGHTVHRLPVDQEGRVQLAEAERLIGPQTRLVTVMHSNNETGCVQPISTLAQLAHRVGALMHSDAAQSLGKLPVSVDDLGVDLLSVAGHKLYAPKGVGALYVRAGVQIEPLLLGAGHERGLRPGTENVASIVGLGAACAAVGQNLQQKIENLRALSENLWAQLAAQIPGLALHGQSAERLPNTLSVRFPQVLGDALLADCPEIAASTGSACHAGETRASAVILAMGVAPEAALGTVRLSLGLGTTAEEVERAAAALIAAWRQRHA